MRIGTVLKEGLKLLGGLLLSTALILVIATNFSGVESRYRCSGQVSMDGNTQPMELYMKFDRYRWWYGVLADSQGRVWIEVPGVSSDYINHVQEVGDKLILSDEDYSGTNKNLPRTRSIRGSFSTLSNHLWLNEISHLGYFNDSYYGGRFDGECKKIDGY